MSEPGKAGGYVGRLAPSPTGYLHLGHAKTFLTAQRQAEAASGILLLRNDDLDAQRCRSEYVTAMLEDLQWLGLTWDGEPINQSKRLNLYASAFAALKASGHVYPCRCSRKDLQAMIRAPHAEDDEPLYPGTCRHLSLADTGLETAWRFRVPDGRAVSFTDRNLGPQSFQAGLDFGDFLIWRRDGLPSYQLACAVDDAALNITEVVRGRDLLLSTARQVLLLQALGLAEPAYYHCALMVNDAGERLAKRHDALSIRALRGMAHTAEEVRTMAFAADAK